jgi:hypothetical protein
VLRAIAMPVAEPLDDTWENLGKVMNSMWRLTTQASNWIVTELYARDIRRGSQAKMPSMVPVYLYPEIRERFPDLPSQTVAALERTVQAKYRAYRYRVLWTSSSALPTHRYPTPFPVHNQSWHTELDADRPVVNVRVGHGRFRLRLKGGPQFWHRRRAFDMIHSGSAVPGELSIYKKRRTLMVKMVAWLPREEPIGERHGMLMVRTDAHALLVATNANDPTGWKYNGDQLLRWIVAYRRQMRRLNEDSRFASNSAATFTARRTTAVEKHRRRMDSAIHHIASALAAYADKHHFASLSYDDSLRNYCEQFPWLRLRQLIAEKLEVKGITLVVTGPDNLPSVVETSGNESA